MKDRRITIYRLTVAVAFLSVSLAFMVACSPSPSPDATTPTPAPPTGLEIFAATCATCHGADGEGQPDWHIRNPDGLLPAPPLNGDGHTWHHADGLLYRIVSQGGQLWEDPDLPQFKSGMPAFGAQLTHDEIVAVLEYIKSLWEDKAIRGVSIIEHQTLMSETDPFPLDGS